MSGRVLGTGYIRRVDQGIIVSSSAATPLCTYQYATNNTPAEVEAVGWFNTLAPEAPVGSVIEARLDLDGTPELKNYIVSANTGTVVTVKLQKTAAG